eukprot:SAG31_NODE_5429_length_2544_cov_1.166462_2_plen_373_part_00
MALPSADSLSQPVSTTQVVLSAGVRGRDGASIGMEMDRSGLVSQSHSCAACIAGSDSSCCERSCVSETISDSFVATASEVAVTVTVTAGGGTDISTPLPASVACIAPSPPTLEIWSELTYTQQTNVHCASNPCRNDGVCIDVSNGFVCDCPMLYVGPVCEWNAKIVSATSNCTGAGSVTATNLSLLSLVSPPAIIGAVSGYVIDSARLYTSARGDFLNAVAKFVQATTVDGIKLNASGSSCYPDCVCCNRETACISAYDVTDDVIHDLALEVSLKASASVGSTTGCPLSPVMTATSTLAVSLFQTLTLPCTCSAPGCACAIDFSDYVPEGKEVDVAWLTVFVKGDLSGRSALSSKPDKCREFHSIPRDSRHK